MGAVQKLVPVEVLCFCPKVWAIKISYLLQKTNKTGEMSEYHLKKICLPRFTSLPILKVVLQNNCNKHKKGGPTDGESH